MGGGGGGGWQRRWEVVSGGGRRNGETGGGWQTREATGRDADWGLISHVTVSATHRQGGATLDTHRDNTGEQARARDLLIKRWSPAIIFSISCAGDPGPGQHTHSLLPPAMRARLAWRVSRYTCEDWNLPRGQSLRWRRGGGEVRKGECGGREGGGGG